MTDHDTTATTDPATTESEDSTVAESTFIAEPESVSELVSESQAGLSGYNYAYLDEHTKREVRRGVLKAISLPGHQVPFASREMPLARGWGTGGIQVSLSLLGPDDTFKVIDQGSDESVNAANIRRLAKTTADVDTTTDTTEASIIQTRHRIPEEVLTDDQILVLQVPTTDPLRRVDGSDDANRRRHAHKDYSKMWVALYENVVEWDEIQISARYPVMVDGRYLMDPSPIPRWDTTKLNDADSLFLLAAGREARIYAVPPHTDVEPLAFEDRSFQVERFDDKTCHRCGSADTYLTEVTDDDGVTRYACNDASFCEKRVENPSLTKDHHLDANNVAWGPETPDPMLAESEGLVETDGGEAHTSSAGDNGGDDE
ncbi:alpha-D-ribose 1-methylphosphonate 5-phosphate C-P-lyase PhnJ [Haloferax volcanii]|uniref:alpha-D-ribose 1-methylphosphonate 5-phosphate C-P-lyase PhnJ n=1 Tax=Haloferax volcanii TaxID=2246 RepID=UPI00249B0FC2|nr:alpha-D-ribose 1-methylphosphonate 5-phosphate C-P-lyase PhnJ [Haloferax alexandrinus]